MWKAVLIIVLAYDLNVSLGDDLALWCKAGDSISFGCPCCPEELGQCKFKKLFQSGHIAVNGTSLDGNYEFNDNKTHITLKECNENNEGTYIWMCGGCNANQQFHLEVHKVNKTSLTCYVGNEVSFECPCCTEGGDCTFGKIGEGDVLRGGVLIDPRQKYKSEDKTRIALKECNEEDRGTYEWACKACKSFSQFLLQVLSMTSFAPDSTLKCSAGGKVSFKCPCCDKNLGSCNFRKLGRDAKSLVADGKSANPGFEVSREKSEVTLKKCAKGEEGTYEWACGECGLYAKFTLDVTSAELPEIEEEIKEKTEQGDFKITRPVKKFNEKSGAAPTFRSTLLIVLVATTSVVAR